MVILGTEWNVGEGAGFGRKGCKIFSASVQSVVLRITQPSEYIDLIILSPSFSTALLFSLPEVFFPHALQGWTSCP